MPAVHAPMPLDPAVIERVLLHGDLRQLTPAQKVAYYGKVCESVGLNPLTRPFAYIVLNGKEILYALREATEQLRFMHQISVAIKSREAIEGCYVVTANATMPSGRQDESTGVVPLEGSKGEMRANLMMKCETKAKRRVTLSICGLGMLDETEVASIPNAMPVVSVDPTTGEELGNGSEPPKPKPEGFDERLRALQGAADGGWKSLNQLWTSTPPELTAAVSQPEREMLKQRARQADAKRQAATP